MHIRTDSEVVGKGGEQGWREIAVRLRSGNTTGSTTVASSPCVPFQYIYCVSNKHTKPNRCPSCDVEPYFFGVATTEFDAVSQTYKGRCDPLQGVVPKDIAAACVDGRWELQGSCTPVVAGETCKDMLEVLWGGLL